MSDEFLFYARTLITMHKYFKDQVGFFPEGHDLLFADYRDPPCHHIMTL